MLLAALFLSLSARVVGIETGSDCGICKPETRTTTCAAMPEALRMLAELQERDKAANFSHWEYRLVLCKGER